MRVYRKSCVRMGFYVFSFRKLRFDGLLKFEAYGGFFRFGIFRERDRVIKGKYCLMATPDFHAEIFQKKGFSFGL